MTDYPTPAERQTEAASVALRRDVRTIAIHNISWGGVIAGIVVALVVQFVLCLLGVGVGLAVLNPGAGGNPSAGSYSMAAGIWFLVAGIIASFVGGLFASRLSGRPLKSTGVLQGLTTWAGTTIVVTYLVAVVFSGVLGGLFTGISSAVGGLGSVVATAAQTAVPAAGGGAGSPFSSIESEVRQLTAGNDPAALRDAAVAALKAALTGNQAQVEDAKNRAAQALARAENVSVDQARGQVDQYARQYQAAVQQAKQDATKAAKAAATVVTYGAFGTFAALVLGAIAACLGGLAGTTRRLPLPPGEPG
jgi:hypothetical protein